MQTATSPSGPQPAKNLKTIQAFDKDNNLLDWSTIADAKYTQFLVNNWRFIYDADIDHIDIVLEDGQHVPYEG